jgi:hypothetical protein
MTINPPESDVQDNLTAKQNDYAIFLPAISSFYGGYIGRQRTINHVDPARMPAGIPDMEQLNWLNPQKGLFPYRWSLYSAGHADLDMKKHVPKEDMVRDRDPNSIMLADSGGFQIAKGVWDGDWKANSGCPKAQKKREAVLEWQDGIATYGLTLDIPTWTCHFPGSNVKTGIYNYQDAVDATIYNNEYFIANRKGVDEGGCKILNVLQGGHHGEADLWYDTMKHFSDPKKHSKHFNGWGMGGQNMCDVNLILRRLVHLIHDNLLEPGVHDWMHFLGTSKLEWAVLLTAIQRSIRQYHNPNFTISFDCASPFLATANGQLYHNITTENRKKWSYQMSPTADDKKYATDSRLFGDAVRQDNIHPKFEDSPISARLKISDVCHYQPGMLNKIGREGKTSWDSFSYALLMGHNVWMHLESVQRANRQFDLGIAPDMMVNPYNPDLDVAVLIDRIFSAKDRQKSLQIIGDNAKVWQRVVGTRGATGKRSVNPIRQFNNLFDVEEVDIEELDYDKLEQLESLT